MMQVITPSQKGSPKHFDNLSETSTESCEVVDSLDRHEFAPRTKHGNNKAKSSLCKNFMETGSCPYGSKCQFAHGPSELKCNSDQHMSYKTRPCHAFSRKDFCTYGKRCNFLHLSEPVEPCLRPDSGFWGVVLEGRKSSSRLITILGSQ